MKTVLETLKQSGDTCTIVKKGAKYLGARNGELAFIQNRSLAFAFESREQAIDFIGNVTVDTRNARLIGSKCFTCPLTKN